MLPQSVLNLSPNQSWQALTSSEEDELRSKLRGECQDNLYFLAKGVLGYTALVHRFHKPLCDHVANESHLRKLYLVPRGFYKTTIITKANVIREILRNPNIRVLLCNLTADNAQHFLWEIRLHFEKNEILQWLFPEIIPDFAKANRWNNSEILLNRTQDFGEATIEAIGVGGKLTSRHFDLHVKDDIVDHDVVTSATELQKTKDWLAYTESIFINPSTGRDFVVGTRYAWNDPYGDILSERIENVGDIPSLYGVDFESNGYLVHMRSAVENGVHTLPEVLNEVSLSRLKRKVGKFIYSSQYLNFPFSSDAKSFDRSWLRHYTIDNGGNCTILDTNGKTLVFPRENLYITMRIDPSTGESKSTRDRSSIIVDGVASGGKVFILEAWARKCKPAELFDAVVSFYKRWFPCRVCLEAVGGFKILVPELKEFCRRKGISPYFFPLKTTRDKQGRISSYDSRFEHGDVLIRESMTDFINEYISFPDPSVPDDLLDAFCYGDQVWSVPEDEETMKEWEDEENRILKFRQRSITGY